MPATTTPLIIPADVPTNQHAIFLTRLEALTHNTKHLFLFAADHKLEHLNDDFYGATIAPDALHPEHIFTIASQARIGGLATQFGLIARYGMQYKNINYVVKINSKTNIIPANAAEPLSRAWYQVEQVAQLAQSGLNICGVGYTIYLGSEQEQIMLQEAAQMVYHAHQHGLVALLWIYPRGKHVADPISLRMISGAAGVANALGADFVKLHMPATTTHDFAELIKVAIAAAGNTGIIASGGERTSKEALLNTVTEQMKLGLSGAAIGRNIYQLDTNEAIALANQVADLIYRS